MATTEEGWHALPDKTRLYTKTWKPANAPAAILVFVHGFSDHCNAYYTFFPTLAARGIQTVAFDQRGWGRSVTTPASRGSTGPTALVLDDLTSILRAQLPSAAPLFLMGHSMGGAEVLYYAVHGPLDVRRHIVGFLAESPWIALDQATQPSKALLVASRLAATIIPKRQLVQKIKAKLMSRDEAVCQAFENDELSHDMGTFEGFAGMLTRAADLDSGLAAPTDGKGEGQQYRIWVAHGSGDRVTSYEASKRFVARLGVVDKDFKTYDGWFHKLHAEPGQDKITYANDVADWILARNGVASKPQFSDPTAKSRL